MKIKAKIDFKPLIKHLKAVDDQVKSGTAAALNRAVQKTQTASIRNLATLLKVAQKIVKRKIRFSMRDRANKRRLDAKLFLVTSPIPVAYLGRPVRTKAGARVRGMVYQHGFGATMPKSGHFGVYRRTGKNRFPIEEFKKPIQVEMDRIAKTNMDSIGMEEFQKRLKHEMDRRLK